MVTAFPSTDSQSSGPATTIPPLNVSGLIIAKSELIAALRRLYVPQLLDITVLDETSFLFRIGSIPDPVTEDPT